MKANFPAVLVGLTLVVSGCDLEAIGSPANVFRATFSVDPGPYVRDLQGEGRGAGDNTNCYLRFQVPRPELDRLIGANFTQLTAAEFTTKTEGARLVGHHPTWWTPLAGSPTVFLESASFHPPHARGQAFVSYDPTSRIAYMYWDGSD